MQQSDLFAAPPIEGLRYAQDLIDRAEEAEFIARIDSEPLEPFRYRGWLGNRLTRSFGWAYDFTKGRAEKADPIPDWLLPLRDRAAAFAGLAPEQLIQSLLIRYDVGAGIGWHRDRPVFDDVVGVSLGSEQVMRFRRRRPDGGFDRVSVPLAPRSAYLLRGPVRTVWEHSIAPVATPRHSITFRKMI